MTLDGEYKRDKGKGLPIELPKNYYPDNDPDNKPLLLWRAHANNLLYELAELLRISEHTL